MSKKDKTILIVEDEIFIAIDIESKIKSFGYNSVVENTGEKAISRVLDNGDIDLILMDINLGKGIDGTETAKEILTHKDIPIVFCSSYSDKNTLEKVRNITRYGFVTKGLSDFILESSIEMAFELFEAHQSTTKTNEKVKISEDRFQKMLTLIPDMVSIHDSEMNILYSNWNGFAAVPKEKRVINTKCYKTYRNFDSICPDCQAKTVFETKKTFHTVAKLPENIWVDLKVIPVLDGNNNILYFVEWVRDITESKQAEELIKRQNEELNTANEELQSTIEELNSTNEEFEATNEELAATNEELRITTEELQKSKEHYHIIFNTISHGIIHNAADGSIVSVNPAAEKILGLTDNQIMEKTSMDTRWKMILEDGTTVPGSEHPTMIALKTGKQVGPVVRGIFHPDKNKHIWLKITAIPLFKHGEKIPYQSYAVFEDITANNSRRQS